MYLGYVICHALTATFLLRLSRAAPSSSSSPYRILNCGTRTPLVRSILATMTNHVLGTIDLIEASSPPNPQGKAYIEFFPGVPASSPSLLFARIATAANLRRGPMSHAPSITCLGPGSPGGSATGPFADCLHNQHPSLATLLSSVTRGTTVALCPAFFGLPLVPTPGMCNRVVNARQPGVTMLAGTDMSAAQVPKLVQELARAYLGKAVLRREEQVEEANACAALGGEKAVRNPGSYAVYVGNVIAGCTDFPPTPFRSYEPPRMK